MSEKQIFEYQLDEAMPGMSASFRIYYHDEDKVYFFRIIDPCYKDKIMTSKMFTDLKNELTIEQRNVINSLIAYNENIQKQDTKIFRAIDKFLAEKKTDEDIEIDKQKNEAKEKIYNEEIELLKINAKEQEKDNFRENEINWLTSDFYKEDTWDKVKGHCKKLWHHEEEIKTRFERLGIEDQKSYPKNKWFFLGYSKDTIKGMPQLIESVQKRIPLVREVIAKFTEGKGEEKKTTIYFKYFFFDEKFDKRHDGFQQDAFSMDFWIYRVITEEGKDYYVLSQQQLPNETCTFKGMLVEMDDSAELSRTMSLKSLSRLFFLKSYETAVKIVSKAEIVKFTKERGLDELNWNLFLNLHPNGNINVFDDDVQMLRSAVVLSGKRDGYGLHLGIMGKAGTKKSMGWLETLNYKFEGNTK